LCVGECVGGLEKGEECFFIVLLEDGGYVSFAFWGFFKQYYHGQSEFVLFKIGAERFSLFGLVGGDVEQVVRDLKSNAEVEGV